jgi:hypothetical protein
MEHFERGFRPEERWGKRVESRVAGFLPDEGKGCPGISEGNHQNSVAGDSGEPGECHRDIH